MNKEYANEMAKWTYDGVFKGVFTQPYIDSYDEKTGLSKGPGGCDGYAILSEENNLMGIFEYYFEEGTIEIGLALNPNKIGKGFGVDFLKAGIKHGIEKYHYKGNYIKLNVNIKNEPAIRIYEKVGFKTVNHTYDNNGSIESIEMRKTL